MATIEVMGRNVQVALIMRDAKVLHSGDVLNSYPKDFWQGQVIEVAFATRSGNPYFVYYICEEYYFSVPGGAMMSIADLANSDPNPSEFRNTVSNQLAVFLVQLIAQKYGEDIRSELASFSHNTVDTNVLAYVESLGEWYPIQSSAADSEADFNRKLNLANTEPDRISELIAVREAS